MNEIHQKFREKYPRLLKQNKNNKLQKTKHASNNESIKK